MELLGECDFPPAAAELANALSPRWLLPQLQLDREAFLALQARSNIRKSFGK